MQVAHKIELKPNNKQKTYFAKACGVSRFSYNWGLREWQRLYEENKNILVPEEIHKISGMSLKKSFNNIKRAEFPWALEVTKYAAQQPFLDLGIKSLITTSEGHKFSNESPLRRSFRQLKRSQRQLSKKLAAAKKNKVCLKCARNFQKQKLKVSRLHYKVSCQRRDILHKTTTFLSSNYSIISIEDLNVKGMVKNHNLSLSIQDVGFGEFRRQLSYKCARGGVELVEVDRFYPSSKTCSSCGTKKADLGLEERVFVCDECGYTQDRDLNAAFNLRNKIGRVPAESTPVEITALRRSVHPICVTSIAESGSEHQSTM
jgi:putative transposase